MQQLVLEACVETLEQAINAEKQGANRIELCADLHNDGLTPSLSLIQAVKKAINIPVKVMVRPRPGNFVYALSEIEEMKQTISLCKEQGVFGVVFGLLNDDGSIDLKNTEELARLAKPLNVTFHKAIDITHDIVENTKTLSNLTVVDAILSSGKTDTAAKGQETLNKMIHAAQNKLEVIVAGKVTNENLPELKNNINTNEFHGKRIVGSLEGNDL